MPTPPPPPAINGADTAWMLVATALVLLMPPALGFFYGGLVRAKNALNTMMMSFAALGVVGLVWAIAGLTLAFGDGGALLGGTGPLLLRGVGLEAHGTLPHLLFMSYQGTFAVITAALISGAVVERMRFGPYLAFITLWSLAVYAPVCHWVWGGGWLGSLGAIDFAAGTVVHVNPGPAARVAGAVASSPRCCAILYRSRTRLGGSLDVTAAHGVGGLVGALLTGVLASAAWGGKDGLFTGDPAQVARQAAAVGATLLYSGAASFALLKLIGAVVPLRAERRHEGLGLDVPQHGEEAY